MTSSPRNPISWFKENATALGAIALLVAATWVVARYTFQSQIAVLEKELELYKKTQEVDIPKLLDELENFVGSANVKLELSSLQEEYNRLKSEYETLRKSYDELNNTYNEFKETSKLEEQFILEEGKSHTILNGKVIVGFQSFRGDYANVAFNGETGLGWEAGDLKNITIGNTQYRVVLEEISNNPPRLKFRVDEFSITQ